MTKKKKRNELKIMSPEQHKIYDRPPPKFTPEQVIYKKLKVSCSPLEYRYKDIDKPTRHTATFDIEEFSGKIALKGYKRNDDDKEEKKHLDIKISKPSYVIIELAKKSGLTFSANNPAITLGKPMGTDVPHDLYGELRHVGADGKASKTPIKNCRIAYFSAMPREGSDEEPFTQSLNFNVDTQNGVMIVVDPDVRHPGNASS